MTDASRGRGALRPRRLALAALMALVSVNIWTGAPLFAVWVGSQVQEAQGQLSMLALGVVVGVLAVCVFALALLLSRLGAAYDELTGRRPGPRRPAPWLRSMRAERPQQATSEQGLTGLEKVTIASVVGAVVAFEIWFFAFAGSPLPD